MRKFEFFRSLLLILSLVVFPVDEVRAEPDYGLDRISQFLDQSVPTLTGKVTSRKDGNYIASINGNAEQGKIRIFRSEIKQEKNKKKLIEKIIGTTGFSRKSPNEITLTPTDNLKEQLKLGDEVEIAPYGIRVINKTSLSQNKLKTTIKRHERIHSVNFSDFSAEEYNKLILKITPENLELYSGEKNKLLGKLIEKSQESEQNKLRFSLQEITSFNRVINDFEWYTIQNSNPIRFLIVGSDNYLGFLRYKNKITARHWEKITGKILDVSVIPDLTKKQETFLVVVTKENGSLNSTAYSFDLLERKLIKHWSEENVWVRSTGNQFFAHKLGLNTPFGGEKGTVEISRMGWNWKDKSNINFTPPAFTQLSHGLLFLDSGGSLKLQSSDDVLIQTPLIFGGAPHLISSLRSKKTVNLDPEISASASRKSEYHALIPKNIASGVSFMRKLTTYRESRLYLLEITKNGWDTLWESDKEPGYVSSTEYNDGNFWVMLVNSSSNRSQLQKINYPD